MPGGPVGGPWPCLSQAVPGACSSVTWPTLRPGGLAGRGISRGTGQSNLVEVAIASTIRQEIAASTGMGQGNPEALYSARSLLPQAGLFTRCLTSGKGQGARRCSWQLGLITHMDCQLDAFER